MKRLFDRLGNETRGNDFVVDLYRVLVRTGCGCNHTAGASPQRDFLLLLLFFAWNPLGIWFEALCPCIVPGTQTLPASVLLSTPPVPAHQSSLPNASFSHTQRFLGSTQCLVILTALLEPGQVSLHLSITSHSAKALARVQATCCLMTSAKCS